MKISLNIFLLIFISFSIPIQSQNRLDSLRSQALFLMTEGRFEEAIVQLNKFVAANPCLAEGYHTRGLCYEKRTQYQYSVLDLRRARRLDPDNDKIKEDLNRVIAVWYKMLYQNIDRFNRDILINPNYAFSYLEIGKSYRWLEEWKKAEESYDEYLKRDDNASPDEIIRYSEILAKTGSIVKGERVLKKYTIRYPDDWRIWSKYGYFSLWLGNYKIAENAFKSSLNIKPFFKEAEDGLDLAKSQGYLTPYKAPAPPIENIEYPVDRFYRLLIQYPENDQMRFELINELINANRYEEAYQQLQYLFPTYKDDEQFKTKYSVVAEYRDSTFYRDVNHYTELLKNNPTDKEAVLKLSEAYGRLYYYDSAIEILSEYLQDIPEDQGLDARFKYSQYCAWNYDWKKAITELNKLIALDPNNLDYQLLRGQIGAWTAVDLDISEQYLLNVINSRADDIQALIALGTIYSMKNNFQDSKKYFDTAFSIAPENRDLRKAIVNYELRLSEYKRLEMLAFLKSEARRYAGQGEYVKSFENYEKYKNNIENLENDELVEYAGICSEAKKYQQAINAYSKLLDQEFNYSLALRLAKVYYLNQEPINALRVLDNLTKIDPQNGETKLLSADTYVMLNQLDQAESIYRNLLSLSQDETNRNILLMRLAIIGDYFVKSKNYEKAISLYNELQGMTNDSELIKAFFLKQINISYALIHDKKFSSAENLLYSLHRKNKDEELRKELNYRRLFLGDVYTLEQKYGAAENIYNDILLEARDTSDFRIIQERLRWLPASSLSRGFRSVKSFINYLLPTNISFAPFTLYYRDNKKFQFMNYGANLDIGFIGFLSIGASWARTNLNNIISDKDFTQIKGTAGIYLNKYFSLRGGYGVLNIFGEPDKRIGNISFRYQQPEEFSLTLAFENNDARMILYSPYINNIRINANYFRLFTHYDYRNEVNLAGNYSYFNLGDRNEGNDLQLRLGKKFLENVVFGYEYYFTDYAYISPNYYSPQNFNSHSIWAGWNVTHQQYKFKLDAKIGYSPSIVFILSEVFGEITYNPIGSLHLTGRLGYSNSFKFDSGYKSYSASLIAYWGLF